MNKKLRKENFRKIAISRLSIRTVVVILLFVILEINTGFRTNALNKNQNANRSNSVVSQPKIHKSNFKKRKSDYENSLQDVNERIAKLEKRLNDLEKRLKECEDKNQKVREESDKKEKSKKLKRKGKRIQGKSWVWPVPDHFLITSEFNSRTHGAIDISGERGKGSIYGAKVVAANNGTVTTTCTDGRGGGYGNYIIIDHGNGKTTLYGHLSSVSVKDGQKVSAGEKIGKVGSTGFSTGPHLHFEYRVNGVRTDPKNILNY